MTAISEERTAEMLEEYDALTTKLRESANVERRLIRDELKNLQKLNDEMNSPGLVSAA